MSWTIDSIPAVCITLERRPDRWKRFQDQSGSFHVTRFLGVDGKKIDIDSDQRVATLTKRNIKSHTRRAHEELDSIGGVGCALSHIAVWQRMVDLNQELCLVFEDDAVLVPDFKERANHCIQNSLLRDPKAWDLWLLGGMWDDLSSIPGEKNVVRVGAFILFHAYVITLSCAKRLLQDVYPIHAHIDAWVSIYSHMNDIRLIGCQDLKIKQNPKAVTDIQSDKECALCNVSTDFNKKYVMVPRMDLYIMRGSQVLCAGFIAYMVYMRYKA